MNYNDMLREAKALFDKAETILTNPEATPEEASHVDQMVMDAKALQTKAARLQDIKASAVTVQAEADKQQEKELKIQSQTTAPAAFKAWNEFLEAAHFAGRGGRPDPRLVWFKESPDGKERKDMVENVGISGGFLVPPEFLMELQAVQAERAIVRPRATRIRMARRQVNIPVLSQTGTTAGVPHWFGGLTFYWADEAAEKTESDPSFRQVQLVAHKLIGYTRASDELVDDAAISLSDFLSGPLGFAGGVTWMEDYAFLQGTGAGQPLGVINAGATITVNRASTTTPIQYADLVGMYEHFLPSGQGIWLFSQSAMSNLLSITDTAGNYIWLPNMQPISGIPSTLFGLPVMFTEKLPAVGSAGDVLLADFNYYLLGDRQATTIESTRYDRWQYDQTSWRVVHRVDGQPWLSTWLTYQDGATTVSPFVILGAKST